MNLPINRKLFISMAALLGCMLLLFASPSQNQICPITLDTQAKSIPGSCTTFAAHINDTILFGNNEDYLNPGTFIWTIPSTEDTYGGVYFGYQFGRPQGGINEKGLAFDGLALPPFPLNRHPEWPSVGSSFTRFWATIMASSATVDEAIQNSINYNWGTTVSHQIIIADAAGDMAVIGPGADGELVITRRSSGSDFLVATNFNLDDPQNSGEGYPCWRYDTASEMLTKIQDSGNLTVDSFRNILDAVHQEGDINNTLYSNIFDLKNGTIYLYYWHQFNEVLVLNVHEEVAKGESLQFIKDLFSDSTVSRAQREFQRHQGKLPLISEYFVVGWYILSAASLLFLVSDILRKKIPTTRINLFWFVVLTFLGPIGFAVYWLTYRKPSNTSSSLPQWQQALAAAAVSASGFAASFMSILIFFYFFFTESDVGPVILLVPLIFGLFLFRTPLLASLNQAKYFAILRKAILIEIISTLFAAAGIIFTNTVLMKHMAAFYRKTQSPDTPALWGMLAVYGLASLVIIYPFHFWLVRKGYPLWLNRFGPNLQINPPDSPFQALPLRSSWYMLLISFGLLVLAGVTG